MLQQEKYTKEAKQMMQQVTLPVDTPQIKLAKQTAKQASDVSINACLKQLQKLKKIEKSSVRCKG